MRQVKQAPWPKCLRRPATLDRISHRLLCRLDGASLCLLPLTSRSAHAIPLHSLTPPQLNSTPLVLGTDVAGYF